MRYLQETQKNIRINLDVKDQKIISILSENARMPLTRISKKVKLSRDAVKYRIKNYEKKGVIQGYRTRVDISKFGYQNYHFFINLNNPSEEAEKRILNKLKKYPFVRAIINFGGDFDLEIALVAKNLQELDKIVTEIMGSCGEYIKDYEILAIVKTYTAKNLPPSFLVYKEKETKQMKKISHKPDKKDVAILKIISEKARTPLYEIGDKINLSADAVSYRMKKMESAEIITKYFPVINYSSLGLNVYTLLLNVASLDEKKEKILREFLETDKNVLWAVKTIGKFNVLLYVLVKGIGELQETSNRLRRLFPKQINSYETLIAFEEYKYTYFPSNLF